MSTNADLIRSIAVELSILEGEVWTAEITDYYSDRLHGEKGEKLYIEISQGRVHTSAGQPKDCTRQVHSPDKISHITIEQALQILELLKGESSKCSPQPNESKPGDS